MSVSAPSGDLVDATRLELRLLYDLQRTASLNVLYYGHRASVLSRWDLTFHILATLGSLSAVAAFLTKGFSWGPWAWAGIAAIAAFFAAIAPIVGLRQKIDNFQALHFAYGEMFHQNDLLIKDIRRRGFIAEEHVGAAKMLHEMQGRLGPLDEKKPEWQLVQKLQEDVNRRIPPESLWLPQP